MTKRFVSLLIGVLLAHAAILPMYSRADDKSEEKNLEASLKTILDHWTERQEKVSSATFHWVETQTIAKGALSDPFGPKSKPNPIPPEDSTFDVLNTFCFDGKKVRFEFHGKNWSSEKKTWLDDTYISVFNGSTAKVFLPPGSTSWPQGKKTAAREHVDVRNMTLQAPLLAFRALDPTMCAFRVSDLIVLPKRGSSGARTCILLADSSVRSNSSRELWVDPERDYSVVRILATINGATIYQMDIEYTNDPAIGWVPTSWDYTIMNGDGRLARSYRAAVKDWSVNRALDPDLFEQEFPAGTRVTDTTSETPEYIVTDGGGRRVIPPQDIGATYEQLVNTEPGNALKPWHSWRTWLITSTILATVIASAIYGVCIFRRKRKPTRG